MQTPSLLCVTRSLFRYFRQFSGNLRPMSDNVRRSQANLGHFRLFYGTSSQEKVIKLNVKKRLRISHCSSLLFFQNMRRSCHIWCSILPKLSISSACVNHWKPQLEARGKKENVHCRWVPTITSLSTEPGPDPNLNGPANPCAANSL